MTSPDAEVPIFLRKLFAMVNEVDDAICEWHADGKSFVIKDQKAFEKSVIPQFFKHSKIASFVRQLNFYSFRKVPHHESLRIDPELEKKTKDWWRFRHDMFQRDKPELLQHIKRTPNPAKSSAARSPSPESTTARPDGSIEVNAEVIQLKKKIAEMTKNIDELTTLVQKVSLRQEETDVVGSKRLKPDVDEPERKVSLESAQPDAMMSNSEMEDIAAMEPVESMMMGVTADLPFPMPIASTSPTLSDTSDNEFVESLFDAFAQDPDVELLGELSMQENSSQLDKASSESIYQQPDPQLMKRLGQALMLLPKEIQEMIVDRLIAAIMNTDIVSNKTAVSVVQKEVHELEASVPVTEDDEENDDDEAEENHSENALPLAAATLAALLHHYSTEVAAKSHQKHNRIPVIPVHG